MRENALKHALARLGGTRLVFSNAPRHYVEEVLRALGLAASSTRSTPSRTPATAESRTRGAFHRLLRNHDLDPHRCALIDDILDNLRAAHRLGMSTVWVSPGGAAGPYVDLRSSVTELPRRIPDA